MSHVHGKQSSWRASWWGPWRCTQTRLWGKRLDNRGLDTSAFLFSKGGDFAQSNWRPRIPRPRDSWLYWFSMRTSGAKFRRGDETVVNPHRAKTFQFEFFNRILWFKLDNQSSIEQFEPTGSQSTVSPALLKVRMSKRWVSSPRNYYEYKYIITIITTITMNMDMSSLLLLLLFLLVEVYYYYYYYYHYYYYYYY